MGRNINKGMTIKKIIFAIDRSNLKGINPPANEQRRLERLYDLTRMVYADHIADEGEVQLLNRLVIGLGFPTEEADAIAQKALALVADGRDEDNFVAAF